MNARRFSSSCTPVSFGFTRHCPPVNNAGVKRFLFPVLFSLILAVPTHAKPPPTAPGKYMEWDGELDEVDIVQTFHLHDYSQILVLPIDTTNLPMPTDNSRRPTEKILAKSTEHFAAELDGQLPNRMKIKAAPAPANVSLKGNPGTLLLRARFTEMNPGSASARVFSVGFAGATHITMQGEFLDGATGKVLVRFSHHNYHSKAGLINRYMAALEENEEQIAESVSKLIKAFYP